MGDVLTAPGGCPFIVVDQEGDNDGLTVRPWEEPGDQVRFSWSPSHNRIWPHGLFTAHFPELWTTAWYCDDMSW